MNDHRHDRGRGTRSRGPSSMMVLLFVVCSLVGSDAALAQAPLGVGLYAPEVPFAGPAQRYALVQALARHLGAALGRTVEGKAYKSAADLSRDIKARKIHFAVLGSIYMASRRGGRVLAQARFGSSSSGRWSIMTKQKSSLAALRGKVLQLPGPGQMPLGLVQHGLLDGNLKITSFFKVARSPDLTSAVTAVRLGQAQAVLAPVNTPGLVPVVGTLNIPPPAFVVVSPLKADVVARARQGILSFNVGGADLQGWAAGGARAYGALAARSRRRMRKMALHPTAPARIHIGELVDTRALQGELPPLEDDLFWAP